MIWTKRPSSQFSSDSFRSDNLVGFGLGATGSGIGRLELKRELLVCNDPLEKDPNGVGHGQVLIFGWLAAFFFISSSMWTWIIVVVKSSLPRKYTMT